jgi:hypothetical protein
MVDAPRAPPFATTWPSSDGCTGHTAGGELSGALATTLGFRGRPGSESPERTP